MKCEIMRSKMSSAMHTNTVVHTTITENNLFKLVPIPKTL
jgi:hypothetical protein